MPGVVRTRVGYAGGTKQNPSYRSLGDHTETIQLEFDPAILPYEKLLDIFWESHAPTYAKLYRQYMSAILYHDEVQKKAAFASRDRRETDLKSRIYTEINPFTKFYTAEDYHQKYALQHNYSLLEEFRAMYDSFAQIVSSTAAARVNGYLSGYGNKEDLETEIYSYGLSVSGKSELRSLVGRSNRTCCSR